MKKTLVNIIKGIIKFPLLVIYIFYIPFLLLSELEDFGSGKGWGNDGFFFKLVCKMDDFVNKVFYW